MNVTEIEHIAEVMAQYGLSEFVFECEEMKLRLRRGVPAGVPAMVMPVLSSQAGAVAPGGAPATEPVPAATSPQPLGVTIDSPIVGTFYAAPAPDAPPFVKAGDEVNEETVVCIVEAMKVMNEIKAERRGIITRVLAENAKPVEYGQPLFELKPL